MTKFAGSQARALGAEVRSHRNSLEWSLETLAAATDISRSTLSRIETGLRRAAVHEVATILTALGVRGTVKERLIRLATDGSGTWVGIGGGVAQQLSALAAYEAEATSIAELQISVIPGLLQAPEYSRGLISAAPRGSAERERLVFTRVSRQAVLSRPSLTSYVAFVDEAALRRVVTDRRIMVRQLCQLIHFGEREKVHVRVLPFEAGAYWGCEGAFAMYSFGERYKVIYQENFGSGVFIDDSPAEIYGQVLRNLDDIAMNPSESMRLISRYVERYQNGSALP